MCVVWHDGMMMDLGDAGMEIGEGDHLNTSCLLILSESSQLNTYIHVIVWTIQLSNGCGRKYNIFVEILVIVDS